MKLDPFTLAKWAAVLAAGFVLWRLSTAAGRGLNAVTDAAGELWDQATDKAGAVLDAVNPLNQNNVFAEASNDLARAVTGDPTATVGASVYELFHGDEARDALAPTPFPTQAEVRRNNDVWGFGDTIRGPRG